MRMPVTGARTDAAAVNAAAANMHTTKKKKTHTKSEDASPGFRL